MSARSSLGMRRIVVAVDGSPGASNAVRAAIRLALPSRARIDLVGVVPTIPEFSRHLDVARVLIQPMREDAESFMSQARKIVDEAGLEPHITLLKGQPAEEICDYVEKTVPDLTVLGSRGLGAQRIHLVGSVGYTVAHFARTPVLLVRDDTPMRKLLVPIDGSPAASRAAQWAAGIAKARGAPVTLLYVIPQETEEVKFTVSRGVGEPFLGPLLKSFRERGITVERRVEYGRPAGMIIHVAREGHDLIVLGHQGRGADATFSLGGVTDRVLHYAPCSTLVVR